MSNIPSPDDTVPCPRCGAPIKHVRSLVEAHTAALARQTTARIAAAAKADAPMRGGDFR